MLLILETKPTDIQTVLPESEELTCNSIVTTNSAEEHCLSEVVKNLSSDAKYSYLYNHVLLPSTLPTTLHHGKNHRFNTSWIERYCTAQN